MLVFYYRLSLKAVSRPDGFGSIGLDGRPFLRETWLRYFFSEQREFQHRNQPFVFLPAPEASKFIPPKLIVGWVARSRTVAERTPPNAGFEPTEHKSWRGALIVIDPTEHSDGQKIGFEKNADIGKPLPILKSLVGSMKVGMDPPPFDVQVHPIVEESSFWKFAKKHDFQIDLITFDVAPPNMFGGKDELSNELRQLRDRNRVNRMKATLTSDTTIDVQQENLREVIKYTEMGAGDIRAKTKSNIRYNSKNHVTHEQIDADSEKTDFWASLTKWLGERF